MAGGDNTNKCKTFAFVMLTLIAFSVLILPILANKGGIPNSLNGKGNPHSVPNNKKQKLNQTIIIYNQTIYNQTVIHMTNITNNYLNVTNYNTYNRTCIYGNATVDLSELIEAIEAQTEVLEEQTELLEEQIEILKNLDTSVTIKIEEQVEKITTIVIINTVIGFLALVLAVIAVIIAIIALDKREKTTLTFPLEGGEFEIYKDKSKEYRFRLRAPNGEIVAASEGYKSRASCIGGIVAIRKYAPGAVIQDLTE